MAFKRMTQQQREALEALKTLGGEMVVQDQDARSLRALQRRGLVRYKRVEGVLHVVLRQTKAQERADERDERALKQWRQWCLTRAHLYEISA
jgi:hypothetical protein